MPEDKLRTLADLKVGDEAVATGLNQRDAKVTVVKVARVYLTVQFASGRGEVMFRIDNGNEKGAGGYAYDRRLRLPEEVKATKRRQLVVDQLREVGIEIRMGFNAKLPTEALEAALDALRSAADLERTR
jgi:hypothetical protein